MVLHSRARRGGGEVTYTSLVSFGIRWTDAVGTESRIMPPGVVDVWERKNQTKFSRIQTDGLGMGDLLFMAYECRRFDGSVTDPFDVWKWTVTDIGLTTADEDDAPGPT